MMLRLALPLVLTCLLAPTFVAPAAAAEPSFDCRTAKTARELATCNDAKLAAADRELAAAWREAIARLDPATAKALREDQRKFLSDIDGGFDGELWGKHETPEGKELRAQVAQLRRGGDYDALAGLEAQLRERIAFLRNLTPAASFSGLWKNHHIRSFWSWPATTAATARPTATTVSARRNTCHFTAEFGASAAAGKGQSAPAAHNTDVDENTASTLFMTRNGAMLTLSEEFPDNPSDAPLPRICPRGGDFADPFFHTGLRAADARCLKPDD